MLTPAQQHFNRVMAERRHASREPSQLEMTAYEPCFTACDWIKPV
jgi:hypothetical protein